MAITADTSSTTPGKAPLGSAKILTLKEAPQYRSAVLKLIDSVFPKGSPVQRSVRVDEEFALLLNPANAERNLFIIDESLPKHSFPSWPVVASASYRPVEFHFRGRPIPLRCVGIGLVVTAPNCQRKGFGHLIQSEIERRALEKDHALFSVLWSDLVQFYLKLGYVAAGSEMQWQFDSNDLEKVVSTLNADRSSWSQFEIMPLSNFKICEPLYTALGIGPKRDFKEYEALLKLPDTFAYGAFQKKPGQKTSELKGYAIMGKARDLRDTLHEFVGNVKTFAPLFLKLKEHAVSGMRVCQPCESPYMAQLESYLGRGTKNAMCFFKVIDGPGLVEWLSLARYLGQGFGISQTNQGFQLLNRHITFFESQDYGHLLQLFFGPWKISELEDLPHDLKSRAAGLPGPLPLFFWGFDSV